MGDFGMHAGNTGVRALAKELGGLRKWCAWGVVAACVAAAIFAPEPDRYQRSAVSFHDFLHVPAFTFVTAGLYAALDRKSVV
jgi:hypothetical protein